MEAENLIAQHVSANKELIAEAKSLMAAMHALKKKLHLHEGCGQRFLQKTSPDLALLQQAEREIAASYSGKPQKSQQGNSKTSSKLLNNMVRNRGQA